jgi:hypothetical protein
VRDARERKGWGPVQVRREKGLGRGPGSGWGPVGREMERESDKWVLRKFKFNFENLKFIQTWFDPNMTFHDLKK